MSGLATILLTATACSSGSGPSAPTPSSSASSNAPVPVESNPPGDIPDGLAFVPYANKAGGYTFTHPEGWARTVTGSSVKFTDKLNGVVVNSKRGSAEPTVANAKSVNVPRLKKTESAFELRNITAVSVPGGKGVRIVFRRNSEADAVTGKVYRDEVEQYVIVSSGHLLTMDLFGPVGADNVDAYRTMSQSLKSR